MQWKSHNRVEHEFRRAVNKLFRQVITAIGKETDPLKISSRIRIIAKQPQFFKTATLSAARMVTTVNNFTARSWREAARKAGRGDNIYESIMEELKANPGVFFKRIHENAEYIVSTTEDVASWITEETSKLHLQGMRASDIEKHILENYPDKLKNGAKTIARTEVSKTQTALSEARSRKLSLDWYIWRTSGDARVRGSHAHMDGVLINWNDPPDPEALARDPKQPSYGKYHAGNTFNDRCYPEPVVDFDLIDFPCKVHNKGRITMMTKQQFQRIA